METLINIILKPEHEPAISARELHEYLGISTHLVQWIPEVLTYGFAKGLDYNGPQVVPGGIDYFLTLDMAKSIALVQQTDKGRALREYLAATERQWWRELRERLRTVEELIQRLPEVASELEYWSIDVYARLLGLEVTPQQHLVIEKRASQASRRLKIPAQVTEARPGPLVKKFHKKVLYQVFVNFL